MEIISILTRVLVVAAFLVAVFIPASRPYVGCGAIGIAVGFLIAHVDLREKITGFLQSPKDHA